MASRIEDTSQAALGIEKVHATAQVNEETLREEAAVLPHRCLHPADGAAIDSGGLTATKKRPSWINIAW